MNANECWLQYIKHCKREKVKPSKRCFFIGFDAGEKVANSEWREEILDWKKELAFRIQQDGNSAVYNALDQFIDKLVEQKQ